jgi:hypothetical protein
LLPAHIFCLDPAMPRDELRKMRGSIGICMMEILMGWASLPFSFPIQPDAPRKSLVYRYQAIHPTLSSAAREPRPQQPGTGAACFDCPLGLPVCLLVFQASVPHLTYGIIERIVWSFCAGWPVLPTHSPRTTARGLREMSEIKQHRKTRSHSSFCL